MTKSVDQQSYSQLVGEYAETIVDSSSISDEEWTALFRKRMKIINLIKSLPEGRRVLDEITDELRPQIGEELTVADLRHRTRTIAYILEL